MPVLANHPRKVAAGGAAAAAAAILAISGPMIDRYEGNILATYKDPIQIVTECKGHVSAPGTKAGIKRSAAYCDKLFDDDQRAVIAAVGRCTKVDVPIESFAAITSFSFNLGAPRYCRTIAPMINAGNLRGACARLSLYDYAGGRRLPGLTRRRTAERALCERGLT